MVDSSLNETVIEMGKSSVQTLGSAFEKGARQKTLADALSNAACQSDKQSTKVR
jgi:hypothetical protein